MRSRNGRYADILIADANSYQPISASFVAHQRIVSERLGRLGFSGLSYITPAGPVDIVAAGGIGNVMRSEEHTSELQSLMRISYAVFCLKKKKYYKNNI